MRLLHFGTAERQQQTSDGYTQHQNASTPPSPESSLFQCAVVIVIIRQGNIESHTSSLIVEVDDRRSGFDHTGYLLVGFLDCLVDFEPATLAASGFKIFGEQPLDAHHVPLDNLRASGTALDVFGNVHEIFRDTDGTSFLFCFLHGACQWCHTCFDTAFHNGRPALAKRFAIPRALHDQGIQRYGFHGLSYEYVSGELARIAPTLAAGRVVIAHLGNGASMCALRDGKSVASTMGFTAVEGLMMGTRTGSLDPGVMLYLMEQKGMDAKALTSLLYKESGLLGVSGISQDMRTLLASDAPEAREAVDLFCYRIARELGSLAAAAGGLDALVFTGGIGEHAAEVRRRVCLQSEWLGIRVNPEANARHELRISAGNSSVDVLVIPTNEEWMMAHHAQTLLAL